MTCAFYDPDEDNSGEDQIFENDTIELDNFDDLSKWNEDKEKQVNIEKNIELLENNRKDIQVINDSMLRISGLLLTVSLSGLYFVYNKSSSWCFGPALFIASFMLSLAIYKSIKSLEFKPRTSISNENLLEELQDAHTREHGTTCDAFKYLKIGIISLIIGLLFFAQDSVHLIPTLNNLSPLNSSSFAEIKLYPNISMSIKLITYNLFLSILSIEI